jgi:hypothetical protein
MALICAHCGVPVTEAYYGTCKLVPFCSQQHARQRGHQCDLTCQDQLVDVFDILSDDYGLKINVHGFACQGSIKDMAHLMPHVDVKKFLLDLFPLQSHAAVRALLKKDTKYAADAICHFFDTKYM